MNRPENRRSAAKIHAITGSAIKLSAIWSAVSLLMSIFRIAHPAFGVQGDLPLHYHIARSFVRSIEEGTVIPRWAGLLDGGRGDAIFTFYPPLSYLSSAIIVKLLALDVLGSIGLLTFLIIFSAQAAAYLLGREFYGRGGGLVVSLSYVVLPAFGLVGLHRAFLANAAGLAIAPLAILGAYRLLTGRNPLGGWLLFVAGFSGVILTHAITTYMTGMVIALLALAVMAAGGDRAGAVRGLGRLAVSGLAVGLLTAFFLWPQRVEAEWVQVGLQVVQQDYRNYMLFAGAREGGGYRERWASVNYVTSLITLAQTAAAVLFALIAGRSLLADRRARIPGLFSLALAVTGLLISLPVSEPVWRYVPGFKFIQFPWRFQPFVSLGCGMLAVAAYGQWKRNRTRPAVLAAAILTWVLAAIFVLTGMLVYLDEPAITAAQVRDLLDSGARPAVTTEEGRRLQNEDDLKFIPYAANQVYFRPPGADFKFYPPAAEPGGLSVIAGRARVERLKVGIEHREFAIETEEAVRARIETYNYPNWSVRIDGVEVRAATEPGSGLMVVEIPPGRHQLTLDYEIKNRSEKIARLVSVISWPVFGIIAVTIWFRGRKRPDGIEDP